MQPRGKRLVRSRTLKARSKSRRVGGRKARRSEPAKSKRYKRQITKSDSNLEEALRHLHSGLSQRRAAQLSGVSVSRFRRFLRSNRLAHYRAGRWRFTDRRPRTVLAITTHGQKEITVAGFDRASLVMQHRAAFQQFINSNDPSGLQPFQGRAVTDTSGREHKLETGPNALYRIASAGGEDFAFIYRLTT